MYNKFKYTFGERMRMKNKKIFNLLKVVINIAYLVSMIMLGIYMAEKWIELEFIDFFSKLLIMTLGIYVVYFISIIWHEFGHLIFGIRAKLKFNSFSILKFEITKKNNKLTIKNSPTIHGIGGYCQMIFDENKEYDKKMITFYFLGGIIFNFIFVIIFSILLAFSNNTYLNIIAMSFIGTNLYLALYNLIPAINISGVSSDMLQVINLLNDQEYIKVLSRASTIQNLLSSGCELKDIDENLFYMPTDFLNYSNVIMAQYYIDYIAEKKQYKEAIEYIKIVIENTKDILSKPNINFLKISLIYYAFKGNYDMKIISAYWDNDIKKYLELMENNQPQFLGINYMYSLLIEKDEKESQKYLSKFQQIKKKHPDKKAIEETEQMISEVNNRVNNELIVKK